MPMLTVGGNRKVGRARGGAGSGGTLLYTEDWDYASTALMKAAASEVYIENGDASKYSGVGQGATDLNIGTGEGGENFVRNTFPDVTSWTSDIVVVNGREDRQDNYTMRMTKDFPSGMQTIAGGGFEVFMRFRYSANWTTYSTWRADYDHKTLLVYPYPTSGGDRWEIKVGSGIYLGSKHGVRAGDPVLGDRNTNIKTYLADDPEIDAANYWDNAWHTMRMRVTGLGTTSGQQDSLMDDVLVDRVTGRDYSAITGLDHFNPGSNRNCGQAATMTYDVGLITVSEYP